VHPAWGRNRFDVPARFRSECSPALALSILFGQGHRTRKESGHESSRRHLACTGAAGILPACAATNIVREIGTSRQDACGPSAGKMPALPGRTRKTARRPLAFAVLIAVLAIAQAGATPPASGRVSVSDSDLRPGSVIDLNGTWLYKPGYLVPAGQEPETLESLDGYVPVPVPQMLNRIQWWLDDSEGFKAFEERRLSRLGFDTDRAEDGWYRLNLDVPKLPAGRHLFILFEGVAMKCQAWCNGNAVGGHEGMFSRFSFDLTPHLRGGPNQLDVYVSMEKIQTSTFSLGQAVTVNLTASKVLTLSKGMFGPLSPNHANRDYDLHGIWQPVKLIVRGPGSIEDLWFNPSLQGGALQVQARSLTDRTDGFITATWTERVSGKILATVGPVPVTLLTENQWFNLNLTGVRPKLWSPAEPNLYALKVKLHTAGGEILDEKLQSVGFRTFEVRGNRLFLNGKPYWLRGSNQLPYGKNPWDRQLPRRLIQFMHDGNQRITRTHATPWNEAWLDAADEIGLGVSIEGIRPWALCGLIGLPPAPIFEHWLAENEGVVRRCRNHPSVLLWTVGNEMLLRDGKNLDKWKMLSRVARQTRELDPSRPVIVSSEYQRDPEFFESVLRPAGIDDGDMDDIHRYFGWYAESPFINDSLIRLRGHDRPLIGQEMSTGYPDLDTGIPVARYLNDLLTPQAWVGEAARSKPAVFLEHHRAVTKRLAEHLRFRHHADTAGFLLFSAECWFANSYDPEKLAPYPVYQAAADAWAPLGLAIETNRRRFFGGERVTTAVYVSNDDEWFRDHTGLSLWASFTDPKGGRTVSKSKVAEIPFLEYYQTARIPVEFQVPTIGQDRKKMRLVWQLNKGSREISGTFDFIDVFSRRSPGAQTRPINTGSRIALGPALERFVAKQGMFDVFNARIEPGDQQPGVLLVGPDTDLRLLRTGGAVLDRVKSGSTAILFSAGEALRELFPDHIAKVETVTGEFADLGPSLGGPLADGLELTDLKWWGRSGDERVFVVNRAYQLKPGPGRRVLVRFIPAHGYLSKEKVSDLGMAALFEITIGRGRVWVCGLDLERSVEVDPAARRFALNLIRAANPEFISGNLSQSESER